MTDVLKQFKRDLFDSTRRVTAIGAGAIGGKASGLVFIDELLSSPAWAGATAPFPVNVPAFTVLRTDVFDAFVERNGLEELRHSDTPDDVVAHAFQRASMPAEVLGDLRGLIDKVHTPLAIRSSSLLEDALYQPFAGIYSTKMIPNHQPSPDVRFQKLIEAVKFVYATTFFHAAKDYIRAVGRSPEDEKMAVVIQEVVGTRHGDRFYPGLSGVARSYNYYSMGRARPEDGVVDLALGLGKTIVDGGICWTYSPRYPSLRPPFASTNEMLEGTQTQFWAVNMGKPPAYDPIHETEYLLLSDLRDAEVDGTLVHVASTYDPQSERLSTSLDTKGPRVLTFARILVLNDPPLNDMLRALLKMSQEAAGAPVEIEFAMTFDPLRLGFLQVRPMVVSQTDITIGTEELRSDGVLLASERVLGNGIVDTISDIVYVQPEHFEARHTPQIAKELETINRRLLDAGRPYLLIGFGRWGSSDPWLGIPVNWGQVCAAKVIVEATTPTMNVEPSQGSHFFHNLTSFGVFYFCVSHTGDYAIDWEWLKRQPCETESPLLRHVRLAAPVTVKVDGKSGRGLVSVRAETTKSA